MPVIGNVRQTAAKIVSQKIRSTAFTSFCNTFSAKTSSVREFKEISGDDADKLPSYRSLV